MTEPERTVRERQDGDLSVLAAVLERVHAHDGYPVEGVADPRRGWSTRTKSGAGLPLSTASRSGRSRLPRRSRRTTQPARGSSAPVALSLTSPSWRACSSTPVTGASVLPGCLSSLCAAMLSSSVGP